MIQKLRFKFVVINMSIVSLMLVVILGLVFYFTRASLEAESVHMLESIAAQPFHLGIPSERGEDVRLPFFTIQLSPLGELAATGGGYYDLSDSEFLQSLVEEAFSSPQRLGVIPDYHLRYYRSDTPVSQYLVFADTSSEEATLSSLVETCLIIGCVSFLLFLWISILLSKWAVRPVELAWRQQRQFVADFKMTDFDFFLFHHINLPNILQTAGSLAKPQINYNLFKSIHRNIRGNAAQRCLSGLFRTGGSRRGDCSFSLAGRALRRLISITVSSSCAISFFSRSLNFSFRAAAACSFFICAALALIRSMLSAKSCADSATFAILNSGFNVFSLYTEPSGLNISYVYKPPNSSN